MLDLIPGPYRLLAAVVASIALFASGLLVGHREATNASAAAQLTANRQAAADYRATTVKWSAAVQDITAAREADRRKASADRQTLQRRLDDAQKTGSLCTPPSPGHAAGALSAGWVGLYNDAIATGLPAAYGPWRVDAATTTADPAAALANIADNAEICNAMRGQILAWQAWAKTIGAAK
jgi:hypothetical protein